MTVTAIHPPSKLLDLDAVVRSTSICTGAGLVGAVTAGPAKLALLPLAGGGGPVIDLAVESPQELALLSKDVAVVRAGDGALWAIGDLGGTPRAKLIARDVRALVSRPQGESALALNQDGSAGAITLSKQEVSVRSFAVRGGTLRACSIGENVSYAVADGEGGGQLRIHPGTTPEPGTSVKTTLPLEARDLDQVRGGMSLSALFKRGVQSVCLVTGGPGKLAAKMAELDGKPADVAVLDEALLVAFIDGRVALYDAAAIANAGVLPATAAIMPAARGKPRVVVVAATSKIAPSLWIGTTSGEILRAAIARDGEKVEEAAPPKSVAPREDLRAELAAAKQALAEAEAAREAEAAKVRALEEAQASQGRTSEEEHQQAILALKAEHAAVQEARSAEHASAVEAVKAEHAAALEALADDRAKTIEGIKTEHAQASEAQKAEHAQTLDAQKAEHAQALDAQKAEHAQAVEALKAEHAQAIEALKVEHAAALQALADDRAKTIDSIKTEHAAALEALADDRAKTIERTRAEHAQAVEALKVEHAAALQALADDRAKTIERIQAEHAQAIEALKVEHATALQALADDRAKTIDALKVEHAAAISEKEAALVALTTDRDALRAELEAARTEATTTAERARVAEELAAQKTREHAEVAAELDALRNELTEERAKLDKDFVKWGERTISLDLARGALDSMLSRAQGVFGKRGRE